MSGVHVATVEIAGLACRLICDYAKPALWARELHPAFLTAREPDVTMTVVYDEGYWTRGLAWIAPDTVADEPVLTVEEGRRVITSTYYRLQLAADDRVHAEVASGFGVGGPLRALYGLLLPERRRLAITATTRDEAEGVVLQVGVDAADAGIVAVAVDGAGAVAFPTPFHGGVTQEAPPARPVTALALGRDAAERVPRTVADTAARLLPYVVAIDRSPAALLRAIDLAAALAGAVRMRGAA